MTLWNVLSLSVSLIALIVQVIVARKVADFRASEQRRRAVHKMAMPMDESCGNHDMLDHRGVRPQGEQQ